MAEERQLDKQSSIKVARNAKGQYTFEVKTYYNEDTRKSKDVVDLNKSIMENLLSEFTV